MASIKILFIRISFTFSATISLGEATFGHGEKALLSGPQPSANFCTTKNSKLETVSPQSLARDALRPIAAFAVA